MQKLRHIYNAYIDLSFWNSSIGPDFGLQVSTHSTAKRTLHIFGVPIFWTQKFGVSVFGKKTVDKFCAVENAKVADLFADTDPADWKLELVRDRKRNTAFGRAVEFG